MFCPYLTYSNPDNPNHIVLQWVLRGLWVQRSLIVLRYKRDSPMRNVISIRTEKVRTNIPCDDDDHHILFGYTLLDSWS